MHLDGRTGGLRTAALEDVVTALLGARHAIAVASPTIAFAIAYRAAGVPAGSTVVTTSVVDPTAVRAAVTNGLRPRFIEVDARGHLATAALAEHVALHGTPGVIVASHWAGHPCDTAALAAQAPGAFVVEEVLDTLGAVGADGRPVGAPGAATVTIVGLHPVRGSGPAQAALLVTDDDGVAMHCRALRHACAEHRLSELYGTLGAIQLGRLPGLVDLRARLATTFMATLREHSLVTPILPTTAAASSWVTFPVHVPAWARGEFVDRLAAVDIAAQRLPMLLHRHPYFARCADILPAELPATERFAAETVLLPTSAVGEETVVRAAARGLASVGRERDGGEAVAG